MASPIILDGKKLSEFRVVDLRQELEKRGCEKSGVKAILIERLQKVKIYFPLALSTLRTPNQIMDYASALSILV